MSEETIHSGRGSQRGIIIAVVVLALFVVGAALLGSGSTPDASEETGATAASDS